MRREHTPRPSVLIIGTGFGGLGMAIKLKQAGYTDITILEKADGVGGTWRDNVYPGAACDVQSHLYSFSFEPKPDWSRKYGRQAEIKAYLEHCADKYDLRRHLHFGVAVAEARFDAAAGTWTVHATSGMRYTARVLVTATGQLNRPAWPSLPGLKDFAGKVMHSATWDASYPLANKRVAVIGSGASAIQFVPEIVGSVAHLDLYQRSAPWVLPKADRELSTTEQDLFRRLPLWGRLYRASIYWRNEYRALGFASTLGVEGFLKLYEAWGRRHLERGVSDPALRAKLLPDYRIGCKRILISNDWYPALDHPHVEVVTQGIQRVEADAIVDTEGQRRPVDAILLGTGFKATEFLTPMLVRGLDGQSLNAAWQHGARAYKGVSMAGFPNLFVLYGPNTNLAHNSIVFMLESQADYVVGCVDRLWQKKLRWLDVKPAAEAGYNERLQAQLKDSVWATGGCTSWYQTAEGVNTTNWPGFTFAYRHQMRRYIPADHVETRA